jgi:hypothetical protein
MPQPDTFCAQQDSTHPATDEDVEKRNLHSVDMLATGAVSIHLVLSNDSRQRTNKVKTYNRRRLILYTPEDTRLNYTPGNKEALISAFLDDRRSRQLDPPITFWYPSLRKFLGTANIRVFQTPPSLINHPNEVILLDDRRDPSGDVTSTRVWDSTGNPGYLQYPPKGDVRCSKALSITELAATLMESVSGKSIRALLSTNSEVEATHQCQ